MNNSELNALWHGDKCVHELEYDHEQDTSVNPETGETEYHRSYYEFLRCIKCGEIAEKPIPDYVNDPAVVLGEIVESNVIIDWVNTFEDILIAGNEHDTIEIILCVAKIHVVNNKWIEVVDKSLNHAVLKAGLARRGVKVDG